MRYVVELRDISTGRELDTLGRFELLCDAIDCAAIRARRFPPNSLVRFDFYGPEGAHVFSASVAALAQRSRRWMS